MLEAKCTTQGFDGAWYGIAKNGEVCKVGQVLYRASSQSTIDTYYDVKWGAKVGSASVLIISLAMHTASTHVRQLRCR